ncbi:hypothetical protein Pcinc_019292 [Petrolisthes cinctipes]|uniref:HTH CENPB-type domain-containing protein n=1 Tax=Petrolisthes cinctipes TaxID=88211 RepID=A0AAE1FKJ7_PETCI|nr:hypothetical protein Pcinc_019292 [Petrolisthes cinctipes]
MSESVVMSSRKRRSITMETKMDIIKKMESGGKVCEVARAFKLNPSTIRTICKDKVRIRDHLKNTVSMHSTMICKKRSGVIEEMERLVSEWIKDQHQRNIPLSLPMIQIEARNVFADVKTKYGKGYEHVNFNAGHGWYNRFRVRANLTHVRLMGEAASVEKPIKVCSKFLWDMIVSEGYRPEQIFSVIETGLFWKRMPSRTHIAQEEETLLGYKASRDKLTLLLGKNAAGDCKLKPLLVYHSEDPIALKGIVKASLPITWMADGTAASARITQKLFTNWFYNHFIPQVENYCAENGLPFKILLLLDNAPCYPAHLDDFHANVKVVYLTSNTTSNLQLIDQRAVANFNAYYLRTIFKEAVKAVEGENGVTFNEFWKQYNIYKAIKNIDAAWRELKSINVNGVWKNLIPHITNDFYRHEDLDVVAQNVVDLGTELLLELELEDVHQVLESHSEKLTNEDLINLELQKQENEDAYEEKVVPEKHFSYKQLSEDFSLLDKVLASFESQDPNTGRFTKVYAAVHDAIACYRLIYDEKKKKDNSGAPRKNGHIFKKVLTVQAIESSTSTPPLLLEL